MSETLPSPTTGAAEPAVPGPGVTVEVSYASVAAFELAVAVARRHPTFQQFGEGKAARLRVTYQLDELDALKELKDATWDLHHKRAWLHGKEIAWHEMAQLTHCFRELLRRPRRDHCFFDGNFWSGFGCRFAVANLNDRINTEWLEFGRLETDGTWRFDKPRIAALVRERLYTGFQNCPAFDEEYLNLFLEEFPERVDPTEDRRWMLARTRDGQVVGCVPKDVENAKKILYEIQGRIRQRRGADKVQESGKKKLPAVLFAPYHPPKKKKGLLARLMG
jgi:hypothetical protein